MNNKSQLDLIKTVNGYISKYQGKSLYFKGNVDDLPSDAQDGDLVITSTTQSLYAYIDSQWLEVEPITATISSPPAVEYLKPELAICECCGAPLEGNKCEYCGSTYIWR